MVQLHMKTDNNNNITLAKFDTNFSQAYIEFSNINNNQVLLAGLSNNNLKFFNSNVKTDEGLTYNNNLLSVKNINTKFIKNNDNTIFPNLETINLYEIYGSSPASSPTDHSQCFDMNDATTWISLSSYRRDNSGGINEDTAFAIEDDSFPYFQFSSTGKAYGNWIKVKLPFKVVPIGFSVNSNTNDNEPCGFAIYGSEDNTNWILISYLSNTRYSNTTTFFFNNIKFFLYITVVIIRININPLSTATNHFFSLKTLQLITKPVMSIDTKIRISDNSIYDIDTISAKNLFINNSSISTGSDLTDAIAAYVLERFQQQYSIYWKNLNQVGYPDPAIINKIAVGKSTAIATLDINGSINYKNRYLNTSITFTNIRSSDGGFLSNISEYIFIGDVILASTVNRGYFNINLISYDTNKYYFQTINIHGYTYIDGANFFNCFWETSYDTNNQSQKFVEVFYYLEATLATNKIKFYIKFNDNLDVVGLNSSLTNRNLFTNIIYIDGFNTVMTNEILFSPASELSFFNRAIASSLYRAVNIRTVILNNNQINSSSNQINSLTVQDITINNSNIRTSNLLFLDANYKLVDSGITSNIITGLREVNMSINKLVATNGNGVLTAIDVSSNLMFNISDISKGSNSILISSNGLFESFGINKSNLNDLNTVNNNSNSILIIDGNRQIKNSGTVNVSNISNVLYLCDFNVSNINRYVFFNSNLNSVDIKVNRNLYVGDVVINSNNNRLFVNNREIAEDIYKTCIKFPPTVLNGTPQNNNIQSIGNVVAYDITYTDTYFNLIVKVDNLDNNIDINRQVYNLFLRNRSSAFFWQTNANFKDYRNLTGNNGVFKFVEGDTDNRTKCGAYFIFELTQFFVLTSFALYTNYTDIKTTIRDFKIFGYNGTVWELIDNEVGVVLNNNLVANVFNITKSNYKIYKKFAFCVINTHNDVESANICILHQIDLYGYTPFNDKYFSYNNLTFNSTNSQNLLGFNNVGISNLNPYTPLSIGIDLNDNPRNGVLNLNHPSLINLDLIERPIITTTRPSNNNIGGIRGVHYLNSWNTSNTNYTIKLSHNNSSNERVVLSLNSDGKVGIGNYPDSNLINNGLSIFNNGLSFYNSSNFININTSSNINNSYSIVLPNRNGIIDDTLVIDQINSSSNIINLNWYNPLNIIVKKPFIKFGNQNYPDRNDNGVVFQVAGGCLIGGSNVSPQEISDVYFRNNVLVVAGSIYATTDITTDSDISYKYDIKKIGNPLEKINNINGYTFKRNDVIGTDETPNNRYTGLLAQEVIKVIPEVITKKHDGKLRIIYANLAGLFVEGIKKLDRDNNYINFKINCWIVISSLMFGYLFMSNRTA